MRGQGAVCKYSTARLSRFPSRHHFPIDRQWIALETLPWGVTFSSFLCFLGEKGGGTWRVRERARAGNVLLPQQIILCQSLLKSGPRPRAWLLIWVPATFSLHPWSIQFFLLGWSELSVSVDISSFMCEHQNNYVLPPPPNPKRLLCLATIENGNPGLGTETTTTTGYQKPWPQSPLCHSPQHKTNH